MPLLTTAALREQIAGGALGPLYVLVGDDEVEKAAVADEFIASVEEGLQAFNVERLHGADSSPDRLSDAAATFPMMAPRRIVMVFAAEGLLIPKREGTKAADEAQERLIAFIDDPPPHATVVFVCGEIDRRRRAVKRLFDRASIVDCGTLGDRVDAERWVKARAAQAGVPLDAGAVRGLVDRAGVDIVRLRAGIERLALYAMGQATVTAGDVADAVPAGPDAPEDFGISNAIGAGNPTEALRELAAALDAGAAPFLLLGQIRAAAERQPTPRLKASIDAVLRTDLSLKSSGDPRVLLQRLVVELCLTGRSGVRPGPAPRPPFRR
jgi:DNA polymerase-3 subunit delta